MKSMTGYGRGEALRQGCRATVELSSVNRRQAEVSVSLPRELEALESRIRERVGQGISRGRISVRVSIQRSGVAGIQGRVNVSLAKAYARELKALARDLHLEGGVTLDTLMRVPGVVQTAEVDEAGERCWPAVEMALRKALTELVRTRAREGSHLAKELQHRMRLIRGAVGRVRKVAPEVLERYRQQLRERVAQAGLEMPAAEDDRLAKELVYFADRSDLTEELTRLESHFGQFEDCLSSGEPVGRMLDFLAQEMNREVNTVGSKANNSRISREVVTLKTELEKFREQVQNVE